MRILFVSSGNSETGISPIVLNQGESLKKTGLTLEYFRIKGEGIPGYLKAIPVLRKYLKRNKYNVIHAHFSLSAFVASFAGAKPLIVSLMGSDVRAEFYFKFMIRIFAKFFWSKTIVKSEEMKKNLGIKDVHVIPNGVDFHKFKPIKRDIALKETGWDRSKKHILFAANPNRPVKNYKLAKSAFELINNSDIKLHYLDNVPNDKMLYYYNAADVVLLTSFWEGSPNVIKEAMACNSKMVATDVGDIRKIIGSTKGCLVGLHNAEIIAALIQEALNFDNKTDGRKNINHLNSEIIAKELLSIYQAEILK